MCHGHRFPSAGYKCLFLKTADIFGMSAQLKITPLHPPQYMPAQPPAASVTVYSVQCESVTPSLQPLTGPGEAT